MKSSCFSRARARSIELCLVLGSVLLVADAAAAERAETADACVTFRSESGDKQLRVTVANSCERRLACTLDYAVMCEDTQGRRTSRSAKRAAFKLDARGGRELALSAEACLQGFWIDELRWSCV